MIRTSSIAVALILGVMGMACAGRADRAQSLSFAEGAAWKLESSGPHWLRVDKRALMNVFHPLVPSVKDAAASATRTVAVPSSWRGPISLRFYCSDDYMVPEGEPAESYVARYGVSDFRGHRFKQVLIDDAVVWERDVADLEGSAVPHTFEVDVTQQVKPGSPVRLTFRVIDKVSTWERLPGDVWYRDDAGEEKEPRFHTAVWFGSAVLGEKAAVAATPEERRPSEALVAARHEQR
jgi:hypothetical protein